MSFALITINNDDNRFNNVLGSSNDVYEKNSVQMLEFKKNLKETVTSGYGHVFTTEEDQGLNVNEFEENILTRRDVHSYAEIESDKDLDEISVETDIHEDIIPIVIVLESKNEQHKMSSQITYATLVKCTDGSFEAKVYQQKAIIDGSTYTVYEIFGMDEEQGQLNCVICMTELKNTLVLPCRHMCLCQSCAETLKHQSVKCPMCRGPVKALLKIDVRGNPSQEIEIIVDDE